ncbi:hypothetical protein [Empedobacter sedimenti]|uniref:hypothetical protein n=1 Tax=Empedobacter sedimenti TaxID=3042610 RepID=UPI0024A6E2A5|nr:hypothetical protein [Empedobacter sedimenti]
MIKKLLNPFAFYNDKILLVIGIVAHFVFTYIAKLNDSFFPDFLSIKKNGIHYTYIDLLYQNTRNLLIAVVLLYILGKIINKRTRIIDIVNVVLISRIAYYIVFITDFIPIVNNNMEKVLKGVTTNNLAVLQETSTMIVVLIVAFVAIFFICVMFYYLYIGFKTVTNLKTIQQTFAFIGTVLLIIIFTSILTLITPLTI